MIDQEGGRVARMQPPIWPAFPPGAVFDRLYDIAPASAIEAARSNAHAIAIMLREVGINVDALPLLDVRQPGANRSEEHTSELQSLMRISYAVFCLKKKKKKNT